MVCRKLSRTIRVGCILLKTVEAGSNFRNVERALCRWSRVPRGPKRVRHDGSFDGGFEDFGGGFGGFEDFGGGFDGFDGFDCGFEGFGGDFDGLDGFVGGAAEVAETEGSRAQKR